MTPEEAKAEADLLQVVQNVLREKITAISEYESQRAWASKPEPYRNDLLQTVKLKMVEASDAIIKRQKELHGI